MRHLTRTRCKPFHACAVYKMPHEATTREAFQTCTLLKNAIQRARRMARSVYPTSASPAPGGGTEFRAHLLLLAGGSQEPVDDIHDSSIGVRSKSEATAAARSPCPQPVTPLRGRHGAGRAAAAPAPPRHATPSSEARPRRVETNKTTANKKRTPDVGQPTARLLHLSKRT